MKTSEESKIPEATETEIPDASIVVPEATQEPFTQSVKEGQAPQEPPNQREGESLNEAGLGKFSNFTFIHSLELSVRMNTSETF